MYYLLAGTIIGLIFAIYTSEKWEDTPKHVWPSWIEFAYTLVAIILLIMIKYKKENALNFVRVAIAGCGVYHAYIGIQKIHYKI
jgi:hypothetical protein